MDGWNISFLLGPGLFSGALLALRRVVTGVRYIPDILWQPGAWFQIYRKDEGRISILQISTVLYTPRHLKSSSHTWWGSVFGTPKDFLMRLLRVETNTDPHKVWLDVKATMVREHCFGSSRGSMIPKLATKPWQFPAPVDCKNNLSFVFVMFPKHLTSRWRRWLSYFFGGSWRQVVS